MPVIRCVPLIGNMTVVLVATIVVMVRPLPAFAQSVVITPTSAEAYVHLSDDNSLLVDIRACARFDRPVTYVEIRVFFNHPRYPLPGFAMISKPGAVGTYFCGTKRNFRAGPPGDVTLDIRWSAHAGSGLNEGHASTTASYTVPELPPVSKFTPEQKRRLSLNSEVAFLLDAVHVAGALGILAAVSGGLIAAAFAPVAGVIAIISIGYGALSLHQNLLAQDPPDPNYTVTVVAQPVSLPPYVAGNGISPAAADALNALRQSQESQISLGAAMVAALYKAQGAAAAGDTAWEATQTLATADFARRLALALQGQAQLRRTARSALEAGSFPVLAVTEAMAAAGRDSLDSAGMPASVNDLVTLNGRYPELAVRVHALISASPPSKFLQQNILNLLAPPPGGPAQNELDLALAEAAAVLLDWSDTLRAHPVGPVPAGPPIVDSVQPNQGVAAGGMMVTISGANLLDTERVNFGTKPATGGTCTNAACTVFAPSGTGTVNVTAIGPGGTSTVTPATRFTYVTATTGPIHLTPNPLLKTGGFDPPDAATVSSFESLKGPTGAAKLGPGWEIVSGSVDLVGPSSGQAAEGIQFLDLNGNDVAGPGTISQVVDTLPGHTYLLSFRLAGNPNGEPVVKSLTASFGATTESFTFDTTGRTNLNLGWVERTVEILTCNSTERVTFHTTTTGQRGPNIDAVSVVDLGLAPALACAAPDNRPPVAQNQTVSTTAGVGIPVTLAATDAESDPLTYAVVAGPSHGTLSGTAPSLTYTPAPGYIGPDSFTFQARDNVLNSNIATVPITVGPPLTAQPPTNLYTSAINGNTVTFRWTPPAAGLTPTGYAVEGGISPGQVLASLPIGPSPIFTVVVPNGAFYVRVHMLSGANKSAASNEIRLYVNVPVPPSAPANLLGLVNGSRLSLTWRNTFGGATPTGLLLLVNGAANATLPLPLGDTSSFNGVPGGTYTFRVTATNAAGNSGASNPVTVTVPVACTGAPLAPANFLASKSGRVITVVWDPATSGPAPTNFVLTVTGSFVANFPTTLRSLSGAVGPGSYTLSVYATNPCGNSPATAAQTVVIR